MSDPSKPASSVASRFVSQTQLSEAQAKREADVRAAYARLGQEPPAEALEAAKGGGGADYDPRSLFERLQANKTAKQDKFDEMMKLSNQFRGLDEGETEFLAEVAAEKRAEEARKRNEEEEELLEFRRATLVRASSPPNPLALLTGSALATSPLPIKGSSSSSSTSAKTASTKQIANAATSPSAPASIAGVKRSAEEAAIETTESSGVKGSGDDAKRIKDQSQGSTSIAASKPTGSGVSSAAARKKKAAAALGIVRKKPSQ
ncbi:hypothetical protein V8E36_000137 [Tilletia maclaganii]